MPKRAINTERGSQVSLHRRRRNFHLQQLFHDHQLHPHLSLRFLAHKHELDYDVAWRAMKKYNASTLEGEMRIEDATVHGRGGHNRIFTLEQQHILKALLLFLPASPTHDTIRLHALLLFKQIYTRDNRSTPSFHASDSFITRFKKHNSLSSHRTKIVHKRKRREDEPERDMQQEGFQFTTLVHDALFRYSSSHVLNADETPVPLVDAPTTGVVECGSKDAAVMPLHTSQAAGLKTTTLPCVAANGHKLKLMMETSLDESDDDDESNDEDDNDDDVSISSSRDSGSATNSGDRMVSDDESHESFTTKSRFAQPVRHVISTSSSSASKIMSMMDIDSYHASSSSQTSIAHVKGDVHRVDIQLTFESIQQQVASWCEQSDVLSWIKAYHESESALSFFQQSRDAFIEEILTQLNECWSIITGLAKPQVIEHMRSLNTSDSDSPSSSNKLEFVSRSINSFRELHENKVVTIWSHSITHKEIRRIPVALHKLWLEWSKRKEFTSIVFDPRPSNSASSHHFNLWQGYDIPRQAAAQHMALIFRPEDIITTPLTSFESDLHHLIHPFLVHIRDIWCQGDQSSYEYCLNWMASVVQKPWEKLGVAMVIQGEQGSGKGIIITEVLGRIIGSNHFSHVMGIQQILGQFNATSLRQSCLVFVDEATWGGNKPDSAKLKTLITESQHRIEAKYVPDYMVQSYANFIFASNDEFVVAVEPKDRRFFALQTDNRYSGAQTEESRRYFKALRDVPVQAIAHFLYERDLSHFHPRQVPTTELHRSQKLLSMSAASVEKWFLECLNRQQLPADGSWYCHAVDDSGSANTHISSFIATWQQPRLKQAVYEHYVESVGGHHGHPKPKELFWKALKQMCGEGLITKSKQCNGKSVQVTEFPSLQQCRKAFRVAMGDENWTFEDEHKL